MNFDELYKTYRDKVYRLCMGYVNDADEAEDLVQETFLMVWKGLPGFKQKSSPGTWIFRIATNNCLRYFSKKKKMPESEILNREINENEKEENERKVELLYKFISEFEETDRLLISLELEGVKQTDIAGIIGISEGNVRVRLFRIRQLLNKKFKDYGYGN